MNIPGFAEPFFSMVRNVEAVRTKAGRQNSPAHAWAAQKATNRSNEEISCKSDRSGHKKFCIRAGRLVSTRSLDALPSKDDVDGAFMKISPQTRTVQPPYLGQKLIV
jgi:hypothetical protein